MPSEYIAGALRQVVVVRAGNRCEYCRCSADFATETFSIEHIQPRSLGGSSTLDNLAWSCMGCNSYKGARTQAIDPLTGETIPLFHPRQQIWDKHFVWSSDQCEMVGQTPAGRASIEALKLNRNGIVNLRRLLAMTGQHPPASPPIISP